MTPHPPLTRRTPKLGRKCEQHRNDRWSRRSSFRQGYFSDALSKNLSKLLCCLSKRCGVCAGRAEQVCREKMMLTGNASPNVRTLRRPAGGAPSAGRRFRANWPAEVRGAGVRVPCTVIDISSVGACLRLEQAPPRTGTLHLIIGNVVAPIPATPAWRKNSLLGIRFLREQSWVLDSCSKRFDPAAWLKD